MERLTHKDSKGWYIHDQSIAYDECRRGKEIDLLAAYENTGRTPEEIVKLTEEVNIWKSGYYDIINMFNFQVLHGALPHPLTAEIQEVQYLIAPGGHWRLAAICNTFATVNST